VTPTATKVSPFDAVKQGLSPQEWLRLAGIAGFIALLHILGFGLLFRGAAGHFHVGAGNTTEIFGIGTGTLAYTLGMRHAFDADHISAIDNTSRKLIGDGKRPLSVGFFFSLGHSSVVLVLAFALNFGIKALNNGVRNHRSWLHQYVGLVGTTVSGTFLYLIAAFNIVILVAIVRMFADMRSGRYDHDEMERQLNARGMMNRFFGPLARRIDTPWKMYPIGFLFGLGFDTATEVGLLALAGSAAVGGLPFYAVMALPLLFAAGMSLFDTADGLFMNFAYGWAFFNPVRKVYYNITITGLSVAVAFVIGTIELLSVLGGQLNLSGGIWDFASRFNINSAGFFIVGVFVATWLIALSVWRFGHVEARWEAQATAARARRAADQSTD
jgi:high-affinity nickel-transport protein